MKLICVCRCLSKREGEKFGFNAPVNRVFKFGAEREKRTGEVEGGGGATPVSLLRSFVVTEAGTLG